MSIALTTMIWSIDLPAMEKIVLLRLADYADADGGSIWPSVERVQQECGVSERTVRTVIKKFTAAGILVLVSPGGGRHRTAEYRFDVNAVKGCTPCRVSVKNDSANPAPDAPFNAENPAHGAPFNAENPAPDAPFNAINPAHGAPFENQKGAGGAGKGAGGAGKGAPGAPNPPLTTINRQNDGGSAGAGAHVPAREAAGLEIAHHFLTERSRLWPGHRHRAAAFDVLLSQAQNYLDQGASPALVLTTITETAEKLLGNGMQAPPTNLLFCHRTLSSRLASIALGGKSNDQQHRPSGHHSTVGRIDPADRRAAISAAVAASVAAK